jgi:2,3-bisphosphoglycerate-independent phosphoglycerate mutase
MAAVYHRAVLLFADGLGLGPAAAGNPVAQAPMATVRRLLGGSLTSDTVLRLGLAGAEGASPRSVELRALDATLGVRGLPQSATGQATLFTGVNAAALLGRHVPALPGPRLRALLAEQSLLLRLRRAGRRVTFANAFTAGYAEAVAAGNVRPSATTCAALAAGEPLRELSELTRNEAVTFDVCRDLFGQRLGLALPRVAPEAAGAHLAAIAGAHHLTLYETFLTDLAGHRRWGVSAEEALARLDGLLAGLLAAAPPELTVVLTSDHGNIEESEHRRHTRNPVPLLVVGPLADRFTGVASLAELAPRLEKLLTARLASD